MRFWCLLCIFGHTRKAKAPWLGSRCLNGDHLAKRYFANKKRNMYWMSWLSLDSGGRPLQPRSCSLSGCLRPLLWWHRSDCLASFQFQHWSHWSQKHHSSLARMVPKWILQQWPPRSTLDMADRRACCCKTQKVSNLHHVYGWHKTQFCHSSQQWHRFLVVRPRWVCTRISVAQDQ